MRVELVTGPPGSGKSTLARERMRRGDVLLDMDRLSAALCGDEYDRPATLYPVLCAARNAAVEAIKASRRLETVAYVVSTASSRLGRMRERADWNGETLALTVLEVPPATCLARIAAQQRAGTTDWKALVEQWWREYQRPGSDEGWSTVEVLR